jgi:flagellar biosynthesis protein FlhA
VGRGIAPPGRALALGDGLDSLPGQPTVEPVWGLAGKWIPSEARRTAELMGATVIDRVSVIVTHLSSVVGDHAARLLSREDVRVLTEGVRAENPAAVEELTPAPLSLAEVQRVLQGLLAERVPITDLARIYEAVSLRAKTTTDPELLVEAARDALGAVLPAAFAEQGVLRVVMIDPQLEQRMLEGLRPGEQGSQILLPPETIEQVLGGVRSRVHAAESDGGRAVLVCAPALRPAIHRLIAAQAPGTPVLSYQQASAGGAAIETVGVIRSDAELPA